MSFQRNKDEAENEGRSGRADAADILEDRRFYVKAPSVNAVRRVLFRAPGGARVLGRHDRETIACVHTMDSQSFQRHWPVLQSRLDHAGLSLVPRPRME